MNPSAFSLIWIHESMRAGEQAKRRGEALASGEVDCGFHYQGARQAQLWLDVHRRHAPLFSKPSFAENYRAVSAETADALAGRAVHVIGLGPGGGEKESWLREALRERGCRLRYTPVDASFELALTSMEAAQCWVDAEIKPVVGDLSLLAEFPAWLERYPTEEIRVYTAYGLTPNFRPSRLFGWLSAVLRAQDELLLSANLAPVRGEDSDEAARAACETILPQYDNLETRLWLRQILVDWGIAADLSEPGFQIQVLENIPSLTAASAWLKDVSFFWEGKPFSARQGERLRLFFSLRYTPRLLAERLAQHGLSLGAGHVTPCGQEGVWRVHRVGMG